MSQDQARRDFDEMVSRPLPRPTFWDRLMGAALVVTPAVVALIVAALVAWIVLVAARMTPWSS